VEEKLGPPTGNMTVEIFAEAAGATKVLIRN
jgi:hypothetical protein